MGKYQIPRHLSRKANGKSAGPAAAAPAVCFVLLLALFLVLIGSVVGRYQRQINAIGSVKAKEIYFTSDFLDGTTHTLAPGSTEVTFTLSNHTDDLRCSEVDITYAVTVEPNAGETVAYGNGNQKLALGSNQDDTVTITGLSPGTYTVKATGTGAVGAGAGGYKETLTAEIEVLPVEAAVYKYLDTTNSEYVLLTVWTQGYDGTVTIEFPEGLIPDNTDPVMQSAKIIDGSITDSTSFRDAGGSIDDYASHTYRFFGSGVTANSFKVTYSGGDATEKEPS